MLGGGETGSQSEGALTVRLSPADKLPLVTSRSLISTGLFSWVIVARAIKSDAVAASVSVWYWE